jgi:hypothetical protein
MCFFFYWADRFKGNGLVLHSEGTQVGLPTNVYFLPTWSFHIFEECRGSTFTETMTASLKSLPIHRPSLSSLDQRFVTFYVCDPKVAIGM